MLVVLGVVLVAVGLLAPAAVADEPAIEWTMPDRLGADRDAGGVVRYANSAEELEAQARPFAVELEVRRGLCRRGSTYTWHSAAGEVEGKGLDGCRVRQEFDREGVYPIGLTIRGAGGRTVHRSREIAVQDWLVVSIGDSVASGEGNPEYPGAFGPSRWQSSRCHRSSIASPARAALALEASDPYTSTTFVHLACSGARVGSGLLGPYMGIDPPREAAPLPPQIEELERIDRAREVDAVLLSVGANDVYFGPLVAFCIHHRNCTERPFDPQDPGEVEPGERPLAQVVEAALARLPAKYAALAERLATVVAPSRTLIVDYFDPTRDEAGAFCRNIGFPDPLFGTGQIDRREAEWASTELLGPLNREVGAAARAAGWTEVTGVAEAFRSHGYCAEEPWVRRLVESVVSQKGNRFFSRVAGVLHPNADGHRETALLLGSALQRALGGEGSTAAAETTELLSVEPPEDARESAGEADTESDALLYLFLALVAGALALGVVWLCLRLFPGPAANPLGESTNGRPPSDPPDPESVSAFVTMIEAPYAWVHRRVESIDLLSDRSVRRRVSVDFTPRPRSDGKVPIHAPIVLLKKGLLTRFDLRDEEGKALPLLTREQSGEFAAQHMLAIATKATRLKLPDELAPLCRAIAQGEPDEAEMAINQIANRLKPVAVRESLAAYAPFRTAAVTYAQSFPVIIEVDERRRRVIKLAYNENVETRFDLSNRLGVKAVRTYFDFPELGDASSRHLELPKVEGLDLFDLQILAFEPNGQLLAEQRVAEGEDVHLSISNAPFGTYGIARLKLRASRLALIREAPLLALLSAAALTAAWFALPQIAGQTSGSAAAILLSVPAALSAVLGARVPHPIEKQLLMGPRIMVRSSAALAFIGAGALALVSSEETLRLWVGIPAILGWVTVFGLTLTRLLPWRRDV